MALVKISPVEVEANRRGFDAPVRLMAAGNVDHITAEVIGLICSSQCPGSLVLRTYDCVRDLRDQGTVIAGGFHSPMERECLRILLRGTQPIVICPARSIDNMRLPEEWREPFGAGRLLLLSQCAPSERRMTRELASRRNWLVANLSDRLLVPHAAPGSKTLALALDLLKRGRTMDTFDDEANGPLLLAGALCIAGKKT